MFDALGYALTALGVAATMWAGIIEPNRRRNKSEREKAEAEKEQLAKRTKFVIEGMRGEPGMFDDVLGIAERTQTLEHTVKEFQKEITDNTAATNTMSLRQAQANGTMKDIQRVQGVILERLDTIAGSPPATLPEVKEAIGVHDEHMDDRQTELLTAINQPRDPS